MLGYAKTTWLTPRGVFPEVIDGRPGSVQSVGAVGVVQQVVGIEAPLVSERSRASSSDAKGGVAADISQLVGWLVENLRRRRLAKAAEEIQKAIDKSPPEITIKFFR